MRFFFFFQKKRRARGRNFGSQTSNVKKLKRNARHGQNGW